jgi:hypothetical protein
MLVRAVSWTQEGSPLQRWPFFLRNLNNKKPQGTNPGATYASDLNNWMNIPNSLRRWSYVQFTSYAG